ncbi:Uncharacterised protein [Agrobacterium tumefaciens]|nr:Uncharacterised protein [Agrobacterium tumefaciens]
MSANELQPYTVEQLQQKYAVSLHVAVEVLEHFRVTGQKSTSS